jgi:hypothetical protein
MKKSLCLLLALNVIVGAQESRAFGKRDQRLSWIVTINYG